MLIPPACRGGGQVPAGKHGHRQCALLLATGSDSAHAADSARARSGQPPVRADCADAHPSHWPGHKRPAWSRFPAAGSIQMQRWISRTGDALWILAMISVTAALGWHAFVYARAHIDWNEAAYVLTLGAITLARVLLLILLASVIWVPVGMWIGLRPALAQRVQPLAQFLAAFPANLLFPLFVVAIVRFQLNPDLWLSPLIVLGTQWYILFNVIAGASAYPNDYREAAASLHIRGWQWWKKVMLPGIFPYYVTGAMTASGGAWNASIVSEAVSWGDTKLSAHGLGAYIAEMTDAG